MDEAKLKRWDVANRTLEEPEIVDSRAEHVDTVQKATERLGREET
jgi:hypothetical protein